MSQSLKQVLLLAVVKYCDQKGGFPIPSAKIQSLLDVEVTKAPSSGFDLSIFEINPFESDNMDSLKSTLKSKPWDLVAIGGGVRLNSDLTPEFEDAVNMCIGEVKGLRLCFPLGPGQIVDGVKRVLAQAK